jgi:hypothetical protein
MGALHPYLERSGLVRVNRRYRMCPPATHHHVTDFVAAAVLLLLLVLPDSESDRAEFDSNSPRQLELDRELERHSMPLSKFSQCFTQLVCCNCYEHGADKINCTFFSTRSAAALHIERGATCRDAGKGVKTVTQEYRPYKLVEDQEAGPIGGAGTWPVRPAVPGMTYRTQYRPNL